MARSWVAVLVVLSALAGCAATRWPEPASRAAPPAPVIAEETASTGSEAAVLPAPNPLLSTKTITPDRVPIEKRVLIALNYRNADVHDVAAEIGARAERTILVGRDVRFRVTVQMPELPWRQALDQVAFRVHAQVVELPGGTLVLERTQFVRGVGFAFNNLRAGVPCRSVLEWLGARAHFSVVVNEGVEATWAGKLSSDDPVKAFANVVETLGLHAARFGNVVLVSNHALPAGDPDLDPESAWRAGLHAKRITIDVHDASVSEALDAVAEKAKVAIKVEPFAVTGRDVTMSLHDAPWTDVVTFLARYGQMAIRRESNTLVLERSRGQVVINASEAPAPQLLEAVAAAAGTPIVAAGRGNGSITASFSVDTYHHALEVLAALQGEAVVPLGEHFSTLVPLTARPLESLVAPGGGLHFGDGRDAGALLQAVVVSSGRLSGSSFAVVSGVRYESGDVLPLANALPGESARLRSIGPGQCLVEMATDNGEREIVPLTLAGR